MGIGGCEEEVGIESKGDVDCCEGGNEVGIGGYGGVVEEVECESCKGSEEVGCEDCKKGVEKGDGVEMVMW